MPTQRIYRSTDSGAPVLTGQAGSMVNLLQKCLVDGYGSKTAAGWTRPYTGTNKAAFQNAVAAGGTGMFLRVVDSAAQHATVQVYATMTTVDAGSNVAPATAHLASGVAWKKSISSDSTARAWVLVADELTLYLCVTAGQEDTYQFSGFYGAGDIESDVAGDVWRYFVFGHVAPTDGGIGAGLGALTPSGAQFTASAAGSDQAFWIARGPAGSGNATTLAVLFPPAAATYPIGGGYNGMANPSPGGAHEYWTPAVLVHEGTVRGTLRGIHVPLSSLVGVAEGTLRTGMAGQPDDSEILIVRHGAHALYSEGYTDGHAGVEIGVPW